MTASELIQHALAANCRIIHHSDPQVFSCPAGTATCSACGMWNILGPGSTCLFWNRDLVPISLHFKAIAILQSTHPELFI